MRQTPSSAQAIVDLLQLEPLQPEGGFFKPNEGDTGSSAIFFLITQDEFSAMHTLTGPEV